LFGIVSLAMAMMFVKCVEAYWGICFGLMKSIAARAG
jgi:hypothetical protein